MATGTNGAIDEVVDRNEPPALEEEIARFVHKREYEIN
jgi:hypothetical protein